MLLDTVLTRADAPTLAAEVAALRPPARRLARGVRARTGGREKPWQFQVTVDERDESWVFDRQGDRHRDRYADGVLHSVDGAHEVSFARSGTIAPPVRMLTPELMPVWGPPASFAPVLAQRIGDHSLLVTFEHELDPAARTTVVVDERDGLARRWYDSEHVTVITGVRVMDDDEPLPERPRFRRLDDWPRLDD